MLLKHPTMHGLVPLLCILLISCQSTQSLHTTHSLGLPDSECTQLEQRTANGDAAAAWRLYLHHSFAHHNETAASPWLRRAAKLDHPQAQRLLASLIKEHDHSPKGFGPTAPAAVKHLLQRSSRTEGAACNELAEAYAEGYFGSPDHAKARQYLERGASLGNRMCWEELSHDYRRGIGGPRNDAAAYYWISLEARCVDPRSVGGQETWAAREEIASHLAPPTLQHEWQRIDTFMAHVTAGKIKVDFAPFLSGAIDPKLKAEGRRLAQQREDEHRKKLSPKNT